MAEKIILEKFQQWSQGLNPQKARIALFEQVRDIPYYLVPQIADPHAWAASILEARQGSCSPKHYLLGLYFSLLGLPVKYATYPFAWGEQEIKYPPELKKLAQDSPIGYHLACKIYLNQRWVLVDASWDIALKKAGFAVNIGWDGRSDTTNAVLAREEIVHANLQERLDYVAGKRNLSSAQEKAVYAQFSEKFNAWLAGLRQES